MNAEFESSLPIFQQIIDKIILAIAKGELIPGERIASVRELAVDFQVNPNTMQRSLAKLGEMGYLYTERTGGRFVTENLELIRAAQSRIPAGIVKKFMSEMLDFGMKPHEIVKCVNDYIERLVIDGN